MRSDRLENSGFLQTQVFPAFQISPELSELEFFDDFETLHYGLKHYYLGLGSNGQNISDFQPVISEKTCESEAAKDEKFISNLKYDPESEKNADFERARYIKLAFLNEDIKKSQIIDFHDYAILFGGRFSPISQENNFKIFKMKEKKSELVAEGKNEELELHRK